MSFREVLMAGDRRGDEGERFETCRPGHAGGLSKKSLNRLSEDWHPEPTEAEIRKRAEIIKSQRMSDLGIGKEVA